MASLNKIALSLFALAASVTAQSSSSSTPASITSAATTGAAATGSVAAFTFPGGLDNQTFLGSVIGTANSLTTMIVGCERGSVQATDCDFYPPYFITANPSTLVAEYTYGTEFSYTYSCTMSASGATCVWKATGISADILYETATANSAVVASVTSNLTQITSASSTDVWEATDMSTASITFVRGSATASILGVNLLTTNAQGGTIWATAAATSGTSNSTSSRSSSASSFSGTTYHPSSSSSSASAASASSTSSSSNDVAALAPGFFAAAAMGLAAILL